MFLNYLLILKFLLGNTILLSDHPIIVRHDKADAEFIALAEQFKPYLCHLNLPDCEGTIIADQWAITAAHCAIEIKRKIWWGGKHFVIMNGQEVEVKRVVIPFKWRWDKTHDIALIKFEKRPTGTKIAQLYTRMDELGKLTYFVGKGDSGNGLNGVGGNDGQLRAATNKVNRVSEKWLNWKFEDPRKPSVYLTDFEGISGPGDSGGPAFFKINEQVYIAGISCWQADDGIEGVYGVTEFYTRISQHVPWINKYILSP